MSKLINQSGKNIRIKYQNNKTELISDKKTSSNNVNFSTIILLPEEKSISMTLESNERSLDYSIDYIFSLERTDFVLKGIGGKVVARYK